MKKITSFLFVLILLMTVGCSSDSGNGTDVVTFDQKALFENLGTNIILPAYRDLSQKVTDLEVAINEFTLSPDTDKLKNVQEKYMVAYLSWQSASFYEFGGASGENLALSANTYPTNASKIEQNIQNNTSADNTTEKGFPALDYLLYGIGTTDTEIIEKYNSDSFAENRKTYLKSIVSDLKTRIDNTTAQWEGDYLEIFISKEGNDVGSSLSLFVNAVLLSYEADMKNAKFGIPAGISVGLIEANPAMIEAFYSKNSKALALTKITAFIELFKGGNSIGLDDYLIALGTKSANGNPLSDEILNQLSDAKTKIENLPETPLNELIETNKTTVEEVYYSLQQAVIYLKTDMTSALSIQVVYQDGDGD